MNHKKSKRFLLISLLLSYLSLTSFSQEKIITIRPNGEKVEIAKKGVRKGFFLGFGLGIGGSILNCPTLLTDSESNTNISFFPGLASDFKVGYAPSNKVSIFINVKNNFFRLPIVNKKSNLDNYEMQSRLGGLFGITYFFKPESPSFFITGVVGSSIIQPIIQPSSTDEGKKIGIAGNIGFGYEIIKHLQVELDCFLGSGTYKSSFMIAGTSGIYQNPASLTLTMNYIIY